MMRFPIPVLGGWALAVAAVSCSDEPRSREQAHSAEITDAGTDAGDPQLAAYLRYKRESDAIFCDPKLDVVCTSDRITNYCDFDATVAQACEWDPAVEGTKNRCDGVTLGSAGPFGARRWHYNDQHELIGVYLSADIDQYCGKHSIQVGEDCALTGEKIKICSE